jgi:hypothetical protein
MRSPSVAIRSAAASSRSTASPTLGSLAAGWSSPRKYPSGLPVASAIRESALKSGVVAPRSQRETVD